MLRSVLVLINFVVAASAVPALECGSYRHADRPWIIEWEADSLTMSTTVDPLIRCVPTGEILQNGQVQLTCIGAGEPFDSWYTTFSGADGRAGTTMLWGNEVYYLNCSAN